MTKQQIRDHIEKKRKEYAEDAARHLEAAYKEKPGSPAFREEYIKKIEASTAERALHQVWYDIANMI